MASLKRYKQSSENNNRFQDIPPRFKRQKSLLTSQKSQALMDTANQNQNPSQKSKANWSDLGSSTGSSGAHSRASSSYPKESGRKIVKKLSTQKAQLNAEKSLLKPQSQPFVLSPMENKLFSLVRNDADFQNSGPPNGNSSDYMFVQNSMVNQPTVSLCDSIADNLNTHKGWFEKTTLNKQINSAPKQLDDSGFIDSADQGSKVNYSDPDIRTIEMLRELERVADQTDVGTGENTNDKNSLVSHHLRMLMCAVDRYTQDVDEDSDCREDESLPDEDSMISLGPQQVPTSFNNNMQNTSISTPLISVSKSATIQTHASYYPAHPHIANHSSAANYHVLNTWNPWTTPTFNGLDVFASPQNVNDFVSDHSAFFQDYQSSYARDSCF